MRNCEENPAKYIGFCITLRPEAMALNFEWLLPLKISLVGKWWKKNASSSPPEMHSIIWADKSTNNDYYNADNNYTFNPDMIWLDLLNEKKNINWIKSTALQNWPFNCFATKSIARKTHQLHHLSAHST